MTLKCPRCGLSLSPEKYEGVPVDACRECWGYWLDRGEFARIVDSRQFVFSDEERAELLRFAMKEPQAMKEAALPCPRCEQPMEKIDFKVEAPITLDRCPSHGIWFDTRELKLAQVLAEKAGAIRKLFFQKLREP
jgi:Zn-finger nucleic acid-binding protein